MNSNFAVTADFASSDLSNGRIGLRYKGSRFIYTGSSVIVYNAVLTGSVGSTKTYDVDGSIVMVTSNGGVEIIAQDIGIAIQASASEFTVNATSTSIASCGLCGSLSGQLVHSDGVTVADITNMAEVMAFANSHVVPVQHQFLRDQTRQCGEFCCSPKTTLVLSTID